jgi:hypothetical protein
MKCPPWQRCPCWKNMYTIFGGKTNLTSLAQFDSVVRADLYVDKTNTQDAEDCDLLPEVFLSGWEESQLHQPHLGLNTAASQLNPSGWTSALHLESNLALPHVWMAMVKLTMKSFPRPSTSVVLQWIPHSAVNCLYNPRLGSYSNLGGGIITHSVNV